MQHLKVPRQALTSRAFGIRFSASYALLMIGSGIQLPFLPLWLQSRGLGLAEISAVVAAMTLVRVLGAPLFALIADYSGRRLTVVRACSGAALVAYIGLSQVTSFSWVIGLGSFAALLFAPVFPLIEGFSVESTARVGLDYGRIRLWASLSFLVGSLVSGALLTVIPARDTMVMIAFAQGLTLLATMILPPEPPQPSHMPDISPIALEQAFRFLFASRFTVFLMAASLANASHGLLYSIGSVYWASLGFSTMQIGLFWATAVLAEVFLFFISGNILKRVPMHILLCIGLAGATLRWIGLGLATGGLAIGALQALHCVSFATAHLALMHFIRLNVPPNLRNTAQGLYTAFAAGLLLSSVTWLSGTLYAAYGRHAFFAMAGIAFAGLGIAFFNALKLSPTGRMMAVASNRPSI